MKGHRNSLFAAVAHACRVIVSQKFRCFKATSMLDCMQASAPVMSTVAEALKKGQAILDWVTAHSVGFCPDYGAPR